MDEVTQWPPALVEIGAFERALRTPGSSPPKRCIFVSELGNGSLSKRFRNYIWCHERCRLHISVALQCTSSWSVSNKCVFNGVWNGVRTLILRCRHWLHAALTTRLRGVAMGEVERSGIGAIEKWVVEQGEGLLIDGNSSRYCHDWTTSEEVLAQSILIEITR